MATVLVIYESIEGQTQRIARWIGDRIVEAGDEAVIVTGGAALPGINEEGEYDGVIVCGPVHQARHPKELVRTVRENLEALNALPSAFVSVSLASAIPGSEHEAEAKSYVDGFLGATGWKPDAVHLAAGALRYSEYDYITRLVMRMIAERRGGDTDISRDFEYTDWNALDEFVRGFLAGVKEGNNVR